MIVFTKHQQQKIDNNECEDYLSLVFTPHTEVNNQERCKAIISIRKMMKEVFGDKENIWH